MICRLHLNGRPPPLEIARAEPNLLEPIALSADISIVSLGYPLTTRSSHHATNTTKTHNLFSVSVAVAGPVSMQRLRRRLVALGQKLFALSLLVSLSESSQKGAIIATVTVIVILVVIVGALSCSALKSQSCASLAGQ